MTYHPSGCRSRIVSLPCDSVLYLETSNELAEVEIRSSKRYVKVTPRGPIISMQGNPIAKLGACIRGIEAAPMIDGSTGNINVLGHGSPLIYINNRLVRSSSELSMLLTESISNVEIITNPSSKYGQTYHPAVIIRTKKVNEGFHSVVNGNVSVGRLCLPPAMSTQIIIQRTVSPSLGISLTIHPDLNREGIMASILPT